MIPDDRKYTKEHEWVRMDEGLATIGISDHAQQEMGDLVFVELPRKGDRVEAGKSIGTVESVKAVSEIFSPVTGEVVEVNESLAEQPEIVNQDPYGAGWLARIASSGGTQPEGLLSAAEYRALVEEGS
jgi:glycine cleavage system H protein